MLGLRAFRTERSAAGPGPTPRSLAVADLGRSAREISGVRETIAEIADQTKLLALNATIEAARTGEYGKGFEVVANEVEQLAKQTSAATAGIRDRVEAIEEATRGATSELSSITQGLAEVDRIVAQPSAAIGQQSARTRQVTGDLGEAHDVVTEMSGNVLDTTTAAGRVANDVGSMTAHPVGIRGLATQLGEMSSVLRRASADLGEMLDADA